jgi:hypothetical protein
MALLNWNQLRSARKQRKHRSECREQEAIEHFRRLHGGRTPMQVFCAQNGELLKKIEASFPKWKEIRFREQIDKVALMQARVLEKL